ncbi:uncharacterized protein I206_107837 [Kwoniella pini CBS 10737]|uniref:Chromatin modification-related protein EAF7 n=1 Tax=Kwoniella pini CBS 10737 TaxID=1296096 RepID=A0A1B9HYH6_9TREE|nr:uncharacterized protein I206_06169 [Kwoniella pini CBS 10737]OCF48301.1 hypothetical protein I206_06169 [Kwoniella pini CBS 10737]
MSPSPKPKTEPELLGDKDDMSIPSISELEMEAALLRSVIDIRPIGRHRHLLIIQLQSSMHKRTGIWISIEELWNRLTGLYDLEILDDMSSGSSISLPSSPNILSPLLPKTLKQINKSKSKSKSPNSQRSSLSPLSDLSINSPQKFKSNSKFIKSKNNRRRKQSFDNDNDDDVDVDKDKINSKSAKIINSKHFRETFDLPYFKDKDLIQGEGEDDEIADIEDDDNELRWQDIIYPRAEDDGIDKNWDGRKSNITTKNEEKDESEEEDDDDDRKAESDAEKEDEDQNDDGDDDQDEEEEEEEEEDEEEEPSSPVKRKPGRPPKSSTTVLSKPVSTRRESISMRRKSGRGKRDESESDDDRKRKRRRG